MNLLEISKKIVEIIKKPYVHLPANTILIIMRFVITIVAFYGTFDIYTKDVCTNPITNSDCVDTTVQKIMMPLNNIILLIFLYDVVLYSSSVLKWLNTPISRFIKTRKDAINLFLLNIAFLIPVALVLEDSRLAVSAIVIFDLIWIGYSVYHTNANRGAIK